jgi:hypothetical protein
MPTVPTRAGRLAFDELGAGPGLLLLHAAAAHDRHDWDAVRPALAERFCTIALDWPGHGDSPMPPAPWRASTTSSTASANIAVGGFAAAAGHPPAAGGQRAGAGRQRRLRRADAAVAHVRRGPGPALRPARDLPVVGGPLPHARDGAAARSRQVAVDAARRPGTAEVLAGLWRGVGRPEHDLRAGAAAIAAAPTLLVWGVHDRWRRRGSAAVPRWPSPARG